MYQPSVADPALAPPPPFDLPPQPARLSDAAADPAPVEPQTSPEPVSFKIDDHPTCEACNRKFDPRIRDRMRLRGLAKARRQAADQIGEILQRLHALELKGGSKLGATREARALTRLMGCDFYYLDADFDHEALAPGDEFSIFTPNAPEIVEDLSEICWPIDTAGVIRKEAGTAGAVDGELDGYMFQRLRSITAEEARGHVNLVVPKMVSHTMLKVFDDGSWYCNENYAGLINGRWRPIDIKMAHERRRQGGTLVLTNLDTAQLRDELHATVAVTMSLDLTRRYAWHVALGNNKDGPRVLLPTNPQGCLQFFKNRDKAHNRSRREALRHWVTRHYRDRQDSGVTYVRDHLRGATEFGWSDLACEIFVSKFDLEKNEAFKLEAELWRSQRKHNSVKVRLKRRAT